MNLRTGSAIAELAAMNPVPSESYPRLARRLDWIAYRIPDQEPIRSKPRRLLWAAIATGVVVVIATGAAIAATSWGPLAGIGTANHPARKGDALPPSVVAQLKADEHRSGTGPDSIGRRLLDQARFLGTIPGANSVYVVPTSKGKLCVLIATVSETCVDALSPARPATLTSLTPSPSKPTVVWGVTTDDVESISFTANGTPVTAPVRNNFYSWTGTSNTDAPVRIADATAHFSDGSTVPLR